jgi:hypothetical protein
MYVLQFLRAAGSQTPEPHPDRVTVEYRIACSGELYNRRVKTFDWRKSDITRILLESPFELSVASRPFGSYPQELCARMALGYVTEMDDAPLASTRTTFLPDEEVVEDLCSLLSLLSRRLISPGPKIMEHHVDPRVGRSSNVPIPIFPEPAAASWRPRPLNVVTTGSHVEILANSPPPVGVDPYALRDFLIRLPDTPNAEVIVYASRLYRAALELIESRADSAYLLLVSTAEALANIALGNFEPTDSEKLDSSRAVTLRKRALELGLTEEQAKQLALAACEGDRWLKKRFKKFLIDFCSDEDLSKADRVFLLPNFLTPPLADLSSLLGRIYDARSGNLHAGFPFPRSISIGTSPLFRWRDMGWGIYGREKIPPAPWFERIVSVAARKFLLGDPANPAPFVELIPSA